MRAQPAKATNPVAPWVLTAVIAASGPIVAAASPQDAPAPPQDDPAPRPGAGPAALVALLPPSPDQERLALYRTPIAAALARALDKVDGVKVERVSLEQVPDNVALVVDVRLTTVGSPTSPAGQRAGQVPTERLRVRLSIGVRDPARGVAVVRFVSPPARLAALDTVVESAVAEIAADVQAALAEQRVRQEALDRTPVQLPVTVIEGIAPAAEDARRRVVVLQATGDIRGDRRTTSRIATEEAYRLVDGLGFRPSPAPSSQGARAATYLAAGEVADVAGAAAALKVEVVSMRFEYRGVLTARGALRVVLIGTDGRARYDRVVRTGTVVGDRGDTAYALMRYAVRQAFEIARPRVARALLEAMP